MVKDNFRKLLDSLNLSPEEFANELNIGKSGVYKILRGETKKVSDGLAKKISERFSELSYEEIKNLNKTEDVIVLKDDGEIEVQKIVDIVIDNYSKFESNKDFKELILDRYHLKSLKKYLEDKS
ncbi:hypothetical protein ACIVBQ_000577 [Tenacibaculum discolor]